MDNASVAPSASPDRTFAILAHIGGLFTSWIAPLVIYLIKKPEAGAEFATDNAKEALNFQITVFIVYMALTISVFGLFLIFVPMVFNLVCCILAAVKASNGESFRYPLTLRLVK
jgi:uncharacterized protein